MTEPIHRDDASGRLGDEVRRLHKAGRTKPEMLSAALELVDGWPESVRPPVSEIEQAVGFIAAAVIALPEPEHVEQVAAPEDKSESALVAYLAATDLPMRLRWSACQLSPGWHEWEKTHWRSTTDRIPLAFQHAVRAALAAGLEGRWLDPRDIGRLGSASAMRGIADMLKAWPAMRLPAELNPPGLIACPRGVLDLATGAWMHHDPSRPITKCTAVDPGSSCFMWALIEDHLKLCLGEVYPAVHRFLGSSLMGIGADRRLLWLTGDPEGGDGKGCLVKAMRCALGDHCAIVAAETLSDGGSRGSHGHEIGSNMAGALLACAVEVEGRLNWAKIKNISGGDEGQTKRSHGRSFGVDRQPCLVIVSNDPPEPPNEVAAARLIVGTMCRPDDDNEMLSTTLRTGGPARDEIATACLSWLIQGCADFITFGLGPVPMFKHKPVGLDLWWLNAVTNGRIKPGGREWTPLATVHADLAANLPSDTPLPHNRDLSTFLKSVVEYHRFEDGRRYQLSVMADAC